MKRKRRGRKNNKGLKRKGRREIYRRKKFSGEKKASRRVREGWVGTR